MGMSDHNKYGTNRRNDSSRNQNVWTSENKRPKLEIRKVQTVHSQSFAEKQLSKQSDVGNSRGRGRGFSRTNSMPTKMCTSPVEDMFTMDMETDLVEAVALAAAAEAAEAVSASQSTSKPPSVAAIQKGGKECIRDVDAPSTSKAPPYGNNGSSGFELLFAEEIAEEDVEECMLLASAYSQDVQQSQNTSVVGNTTMSQAYNFFSKGVPAHSSILEPHKDDFKKPLPNHIFPTTQYRGTCAVSVEPKSGSLSSSDRFGSNIKPLRQTPGNQHIVNIPGVSVNNHITAGIASTSAKPVQQPEVNLQAETEVRRLTLEQEKLQSENKRLKELLRNKEGEAAILRTQLKQAQSDIVLQKTTNARTVAASQQHYGERVRELEKEIEKMRTTSQFQEAEANTIRERVRMLSNNQRVKLVEPQSPRKSGPSAQEIPTTPQRTARQRHVSSFLNRSTFEDVAKPTLKRPRLSDEGSDLAPENDIRNGQQISIKTDVQATTAKDIASSTKVEEDNSWILDPVLPSAGQALLERLGSRQLFPLESSDREFNQSCELDLDDWDAGPTLSLLSLKSGHSKMKRRALGEKQRPSIIRCTDTLRQLMCWKEPSLDTSAAKSLVTQVFEECCGVVHYRTLLLCDALASLTHKQLAERDKLLLECGSQFLPLNQEYDLLDRRQWYKEEGGVEVRVCLGVLSEIVAVSQFSACLITGAVENQRQTLKQHSFCKLPDFASAKTERHESFWFLQVLENLCSTIVQQKLTIAMNGVLAGVVTLIRNCAVHGAVVKEGRSIVLSIIREVLLCRPASTVLLLLVQLLKYLSNCEEIMGGLCSNCDEDDCEDKPSLGLCYFTKNACILQLLCVQLKAFSGSHSWCLADAVVRWLLAVLAQGWTAPHWISPTYPSGTPTEKLPVHTMCCLRLTSTVVSLLYEVFQTLHSSIERQESFINSTVRSVSLPEETITEPVPHSSLLRIMQCSVLLLHDFLMKGMDNYMGDVEGLYDLLIRGIHQVKEHLHLAPVHEEKLKALMGLEDQGIPRNQTSSQSTCSEMYWSGMLGNMSLDSNHSS